MKRSEFFKRILLGGSAVLTLNHLKANVPAKTKGMYLDSLYIAGFQYYSGSEQEKLLKENQLLTLKRQSDNAHDFFAVEVYHKEHKLGYLPRTDNRIIARMMDQGVKINAKIRRVNPDANPSWRVKIRVYSEMG